MFPEVQRGLFGLLTEELVICMHLVSNPPIFAGKAYFARSRVCTYRLDGFQQTWRPVVADLPYFIGRHRTSISFARVLIATSKQHDYRLTSVENRIHRGHAIAHPPALPSIADVEQLLSLRVGFDAEKVPPACVLWMGTCIVSPQYQFANGAAYPVRTDEDVTFMGCRVRAVTELVACASRGLQSIMEQVHNDEQRMR